MPQLFTSFAVAGGIGGDSEISANIGNAIVRSLLAQGAQVTVLGRSSSITSQGALDLQTRGAKLLAVDYDSAASLLSALHGIEVVISAISRGGATAQKHLALASKKAGVQVFVPSEWGGITKDSGSDSPNFYKAELQQTLLDIHQPHTLILAGGFYEWVPLFIRDLATKKLIITGNGETKIAFTAVQDIAGFTAHLLTKTAKSDLPGRIFRIVGSFATISELVHLAQMRSESQEVVHQTLKEALKAWTTQRDFLAWLRIAFEEERWVNPHYGGLSLDNSLWKGWSGVDVKDFAK